VVFSGSVALLSDTLHNVTDALTAIPLWIAFALGRRPATRRYTYGLNRAEDAAGFVIVVAIGVRKTLGGICRAVASSAKHVLTFLCFSQAAGHVD
jgi:divalent metal cation (Fe/Co/Zn/Cd) transporter